MASTSTSAPVPEKLFPDIAARFQPEYAAEFRCIGPLCEDICCRGWDIRVDEAAYAKYLALPPGPLTGKMQQNLVLLTEGQTSRSYATMRLDEDKACFFLDTDRLCQIQKTHGPEYLSHVCGQYPRSRETRDGATEEVLLFSCPEAARLVLRHPQLLPRDVSGCSYGEFHAFAQGLTADGTSLMDYFWSIRWCALMLLSDGSYALWERLFLLGTLAVRLDALAAAGQVGLVPRVLSEYAELAATGRLRPAMARVPKQPHLQLTTILKLLMDRLRMGRPSQRFLDCLGQFTGGIGYSDRAKIETLVPAYREAFLTAYRPWREENRQVLENYLVNAALVRLFPMGPGEPEQGLPQGSNLEREALRLATHYGLLQGLMIGVAANSPSGFGTEDAVRVIQSFSKTFEHSHSYLDRFLDTLEQQGLKSAQGIAVLTGDPA